MNRRLEAGGASRVAGPVDHDDVEVAGRAAAVEQLGDGAVERRADAGRVAGRDAGDLALRVEDAVLRLVDRRLRLTGSSWSRIWLNSTRLTMTTTVPATTIVIAPMRICSDERQVRTARDASRRDPAPHPPLAGCASAGDRAPRGRAAAARATDAPRSGDAGDIDVAGGQVRPGHSPIVTVHGGPAL